MGPCVRPDQPKHEPTAASDPNPNHPQLSQPAPDSSLFPPRAAVQFCAVTRLRSVIFRRCRHVPGAAAVIAASLTASDTTNRSLACDPSASVTRQHAISSVTSPVYGSIGKHLGSCQAPKVHHRRIFAYSSHSITKRQQSAPAVLLCAPVVNLRHYGHSKTWPFRL